MLDILPDMGFGEIASTATKGFDYFTGGDFLRKAQRNERAIVLEEQVKTYQRE